MNKLLPAHNMDEYHKEDVETKVYNIQRQTKLKY